MRKTNSNGMSPRLKSAGVGKRMDANEFDLFNIPKDLHAQIAEQKAKGNENFTALNTSMFDQINDKPTNSDENQKDLKPIINKRPSSSNLLGKAARQNSKECLGPNVTKQNQVEEPKPLIAQTISDNKDLTRKTVSAQSNSRPKMKSNKENVYNTLLPKPGFVDKLQDNIQRSRPLTESVKHRKDNVRSLSPNEGDDQPQLKKMAWRFEEGRPAMAIEDTPESRFSSIVQNRQQMRFRKLVAPLNIRPFPGTGDRGYYFKIYSCDSKLVRQTLEDNGFKEGNNDRQEALIQWSAGSLGNQQQSMLHRWQKVNHFPKSCELTCKDQMYRNIQRMQQEYGYKHFDFCPATYILPSEAAALANEMYRDPTKMQIVKPAGKSRGRGIFLTNKFNEIPYKSNFIVSEYIANPLLVDDFKFDLRIQAVVTGINPLKIQVQDEGLVRFATTPQSIAAGNNKANRFMHLTNYSINKYSSNQVENIDAERDDVGNKWSLTAFKKFLQEHGIDPNMIFTRIDDLIVKSLIAAEPHMNASYQMFVPFRNNCFEIFGFDVLIDDTLKPQLCEVNLSPSLACESPLDHKIKTQLLANTFSLIGTLPPEQRTQGQKVERNFNTRSIPHTNPTFRAYLNKQMVHSIDKNKKPQTAEGGMRTRARGLDDIINKHQGLDPAELTKEERSVILDFEDEIARSESFKLIFPSSNQLTQKQQFEEDRPFNFLLSMRQTRGLQRLKTSDGRQRTRAQSPSATFKKSRYIQGSSAQIRSDKDNIERTIKTPSKMHEQVQEKSEVSTMAEGNEGDEDNSLQQQKDQDEQKDDPDGSQDIVNENQEIERNIRDMLKKRTKNNNNIVKKD